MHPSKSLHLAFALALLLGVGCTKADRSTENETSGASFFVDSLKGGATLGPINEKSAWRFPESVDFNFMVCLKERTTRRDLPGQTFSIVDPAGKKVIATEKTNHGGCMNWVETVPYNHLAGQSGWAEVKRDVVGRGSNNGTYSVTLALNPWAARNGRDSQPSVIFMREGDRDYVPESVYPEGQSIRAFNGEIQRAAELYVQDVKVKAIPEGEGDGFTSVLAEVTMSPKVHVQTATGGDEYVAIPDGDFDVYVQVLGSDPISGIDKRILLLKGQSSDVPTVGKARNGMLKAEIKFTQEARLVSGNLELVLLVKPRGAKYRNIREFNGLYRFGVGTQAGDGGGTLANMCLNRDPRCSYRHYVEMAKSDSYKETTDQLKKAGYLVDNGDYIFSMMRFRFTSVLPGETATRRAVVYSASTCITKRSTGEPVADTPMTIRYLPMPEELKIEGEPPEINIEKPEITKKTDESGCLTWTGQAFHMYYKPEQYFVKHVQIERGKDCSFADDKAKCEAVTPFSRNLIFYLNPWDDKFTFGWDAREQDLEFFTDIRRRGKIKSRFFLGGFGYHTVRFLYNIDPFMDLEVKKTILLDIQPAVLRYSGIINARKMTEQLRDGIYLMKVAIQKNYLDPRDNSGLMLGASEQLRPRYESIGGNQLVAKNFITTNMALVRVVDGHIIYPIELTMRDLRLMRIRSNFLIELQTVDERLIQAYHVFRDGVTSAKGLEEKLEMFKKSLVSDALLTDVKRDLGGKDFIPALHESVRKRNILAPAAGAPNSVEIANKPPSEIVETQTIVSGLVEKLNRLLNGGGNVGFYLDGSDGNLSRGDREKVLADHPQYVLLKNDLIVNNYAINPALLDNLRQALKLNDFSEVSLPKKEEIDLNLFIEEDSGLENRTFVGPVIFLSNAYSDSMRATDNLDEACSYSGEAPKIDPATGKEMKQKAGSESRRVIDNALELLKLQFDGFEEQQYEAANAAMEPSRLNKAFDYHNFFGNSQSANYQYNPNFGALSHLCEIKSVDKLMEMEKELNAQYQDRMVAASLKYNLLHGLKFPVDYVSLTDEPLKKVPENCAKDVANCLVETDEATLRWDSLLPIANRGLEEAVSDFNSRLGNLVASRPDDVGYRQLNSVGLAKQLLDGGRYSRPAVCNLLVNRIMDELQAKNLIGALVSGDSLKRNIMMNCTADGGLIHDRKLHGERTGNYIALGGMNLNFNVGESFSLGTSRSVSAGFELTDLLGTAAGLSLPLGVAGALAKPLSFKIGSSLSSSEGTNISESTYLVAQVAKFQLDLLAYERCSVIRLSDRALRDFDAMSRRAGYKVVSLPAPVNMDDPNTRAVMARGLLVGQGATRAEKRPKTVKEMYFYFTQHFTEGDMLDQAELYNHPWLLALRGMRDFTVFVNQIRQQGRFGSLEYMSGLLGLSEDRAFAWALKHLYGLYQSVTPSFPGFYTELGPKEDILFPLEAMTTGPKNWAKDPNKEVINPGPKSAP